MAGINPYLHFNGNTEEAFNFYKTVFQSEFLGVMRYKDMPSEIASNGINPDSIMHICLPIGSNNMLMGSDRPDAYGTIKTGDNFFISVSADSEEEADWLFNGLSAGGKVLMPQAKVFWGEYFGMLTDQFEIQWMISYRPKQ